MLVLLSKENKHQHGGYLNLETGIGLTSVEGRDNHQHVLTRSEPRLNDDGSIAQEGQWYVESAGENPHTHTIEELQRQAPKKDKTNDEQRIEECIALIKEAEENERASVNAGKESYEFYNGNQWDSQQKAILNSQRRSAITINEIEPRVDVLLGTHDQNKTEVVFKPVEKSDEQVADIANMLYKSVINQNNFHAEESVVFKDTTITGRGCKDVYVDFNDNIEGDIKIRWFCWDKVRFGPHERIDQEDLEYLIKFDNFSYGKLKQLYPKKAKQLDLAFKTFEGDLTDDLDNVHHNVKGMAYRLEQNMLELNVGGERIVDVQRKEFKLFEIWQKVYRRVEGLIFAEDNFVDEGTDLREKDVALLKRIPGVTSISKIVFDMRKTVFAGGLVLEDEVLDLPENGNCFHLITTYAKKYKNTFYGKVEPVKDPQRTVNKLTSQTVDITNTMNGKGWFVDGETFDRPSDVEAFRKVSSSSGFVQKVKDVARPPLKAEGAQFPSELVNLKNVAKQDLDAIMGIPPRASEFSGDLSTKMHMMIKRQSLVGNDFLFENSYHANKRMAKLIIAYIQDFYTPERIERILGSVSPEELNEMENPDNIINVTREDIANMLLNKKLLDLDLVMSEAVQTDTMRELAFMSYQEVMQTVGGDPTILRHWIKTSPFPNKKAILDEMDQAQLAASQKNNDTNDSQNYASLPDSVKESLAQKGIYSYKDLNEARELQGNLVEGVVQ